MDYSKIVAIMQPTYLPWAGYFNLIYKSDIFVFLDDVQFERRSWQSRNQILLASKPCLLTVPVHSTSRQMKISDIQIDNKQKWRKKHCETIKQAYCKHPFFNEIRPILEIINDENFCGLAELNISIIKFCAQRMKLNTEFKRASDMKLGGKRSKHLLNIALSVNCNTYLSPCGSMAYLEEEGVFNDSSVGLLFQEYVPEYYTQLKNQEFISHLSILDVVANMGWLATRDYIS